MSIVETRALLVDFQEQLQELDLLVSQSSRRLAEGIEQASDIWRADDNAALFNLAQEHLSQVAEYRRAEGPMLAELTDRKIRQATAYLQGRG